MDFELIQNLIVTKKYDQLIRKIKKCGNPLFKKGILSYCNYMLNVDFKYIYNPYFYLLMDRQVGSVIDDLKKIDDLFSNYYLGLYHFENKRFLDARGYFLKNDNTCYKSFLGQTELELGEVGKGIELLECSKTFILSSFYLANCYANNYGVKFDYDICEILYKYCVELEYYEAYYYLAVLYLSTDQIKYGPVYCLELMKKAALKYHTESFLYILEYYSQRDSIDLDYWIEYLKKSNNNGLIQVAANYLSNLNLFKVKNELLKFI